MSAGFSVLLRKQLKGFALDTGWNVGPGFTVLFGYSGAGKSLTMSMLTGTTRPDSGHIRFDDEVLFDAAAEVFVPPQKRGFGFVSQSGDLFPHMTVAANVAYGLTGTPKAERTRRVSELLDAFHIAQLADKKPHEISGGQKQRAALARALAPRPRALLLDEPLSGLDLPIRQEIRALLLEVHERFAIPVVMVTHDLYEACALGDTMVVYAGDGVTQVGSPRELVSDPVTPAARRLLHSLELPSSIFREPALAPAIASATPDAVGSLFDPAIRKEGFSWT